MVRWLERNGYDVSYFTGVDTDRSAALILRPQGLPVGRPRRVLVRRRSAPTSRRRATRRQPRLLQRQRGLLEDALGDEHRRLGHRLPHARLLQGDPRRTPTIDPTPATWTGHVARPALVQPADGGQPENALTGTIFTVNAGTARDPGARPTDGKLRFWRNTQRRQPGGRARRRRSPDGTLGYEWDEDLDNGSRPAGLIDLSSTTDRRRATSCRTTAPRTAPARATHSLTLYRAAERRARLRRRHRPVVLGPRRQPRPRQRRPPTRACSRRRSTCSPTWAPARVAQIRAWPRPRPRPTRRRRRRRSSRRPRARPSRRARP